eukprot:scaffold6589_cov116-Isochrysis_galbana.AAC.5
MSARSGGAPSDRDSGRARSRRGDDPGRRRREAVHHAGAGARRSTRMHTCTPAPWPPPRTHNPTLIPNSARKLPP